MNIIDLRSDTVTKPTPAMRQAMYDAEVGDDVLGDDPTVQRLEELAAARLGKEAGLFVASGTMGNLVCLLTHCGRGDEVILGDQAHTYVYEQGGSSALGGIHPHTLPNQPDGSIDLTVIEQAIRGDNIHFPRTRLITLENTHNRCGGAVLPVSTMQATGALARKHGLAFHLDGARLFNAAVALNVDVAELVADCDSVTFCLSKGLGAPVGSVVVGSRAFIAGGAAGAQDRGRRHAPGRRHRRGRHRGAGRKWWSGWPKIMPTRAALPRQSPAYRASQSTRPACRATSSSSRWITRPSARSSLWTSCGSRGSGRSPSAASGCAP